MGDQIRQTMRQKLRLKGSDPFSQPPLATDSRPRLTSAMLTRTFAGSVPPRPLRRLGWQISPGKNMIFPCTTATFTIPQRSGWASSCCADSPWGSALYAVSVRRLAGLHSGFFQRVCHQTSPCRRLVLLKESI